MDTNHSHRSIIQHEKHDKYSKMITTHSHNIHELYYLANGKKKYFIGDEIHLLEPGDLIFVPKGIYHKTNDEGNRGVEKIIIYFDDDLIGDDGKKYIDELTANKLIRLPKKYQYDIQEILRKIEKEDVQNLKDSFEMQKLYIKQLLIIISRFRIHNGAPKFNDSYQIIQDAAKYISSNCDQDLSLKELAKKYAMSTCYFSKQFKNITGVGLNEYINISRISHAEKLLTETELPITLIAAECGFNDSNYFAAVFKRIKGITPKKYALSQKENPYH